MKWGLDTLSGYVPEYLSDKKKLNQEINIYEQELQKIRKELDKIKDPKDKEKNANEIKELNNKYNTIRKKIFELSEQEYDESPKIETTLIVESSLMKEIFIFIN